MKTFDLAEALFKLMPTPHGSAIENALIEGAKRAVPKPSNNEVVDAVARLRASQRFEVVRRRNVTSRKRGRR